MVLRTRRQWQRCLQRKEKRRRALVKVSDGRGGSVFTGPWDWQKQRWRWPRKTIPRTRQRQWRRCQRARNRQHVWEIRDNDGGGGGSTTGPRNLRRWWRRRRRNMSTKTSTMTAEASAEDIRRAQRTKDNSGGDRGSKTSSVYWQQQRSVDFTCYRVANSNTVLSLSPCCLVLIFFSSDCLFYHLMQERLSVLQSREKYFCTKCTLTLHMYPLRQGD